jgi:hypothetical protein
MESISDESLRKGHRTAVIIGWLMILSVLAYAGVAEYLTRSNAPFAGFAPLPKDIFNKLRLVLLGVCLLDFAFIPFLRNRVLFAQNRPDMPAPGRPLTPESKLVASSIITFALCESIVIYGIVLFLVNGARQEFYFFFFLSLIAFAVHFPRYERWQEWAQKMRGAVGQDNLG